MTTSTTRAHGRRAAGEPAPAGNGGLFKTLEAGSEEVVCSFEGADDAGRCGRTMKLHKSNKWKHSVDVHGVMKRRSLAHR